MCEGREKFTVRDTRIDPFWGMKDFEVELLKCVRPRKVERWIFPRRGKKQMKVCSESGHILVGGSRAQGGSYLTRLQSKVTWEQWFTNWVRKNCSVRFLNVHVPVSHPCLEVLPVCWGLGYGLGVHISKKHSLILHTLKWGNPPLMEQRGSVDGVARTVIWDDALGLKESGALVGRWVPEQLRAPGEVVHAVRRQGKGRIRNWGVELFLGRRSIQLKKEFALVETVRNCREIFHLHNLLKFYRKVAFLIHLFKDLTVVSHSHPK